MQITGRNGRLIKDSAADALRRMPQKMKRAEERATRIVSGSSSRSITTKRKHTHSATESDSTSDTSSDEDIPE